MIGMIGEIKKISVKSNSLLGNPNFKFWILVNGKMLIIDTKENIMDSYRVSRNWVDKMVIFDTHRNKIVSIERLG